MEVDVCAAGGGPPSLANRFSLIFSASLICCSFSAMSLLAYGSVGRSRVE